MTDWIGEPQASYSIKLCLCQRDDAQTNAVVSQVKGCTIAGVATTMYSGCPGIADSCHHFISTTLVIPRLLNHFFNPRGIYQRAEFPI